MKPWILFIDKRAIFRYLKDDVLFLHDLFISFNSSTFMFTTMFVASVLNVKMFG